MESDGTCVSETISSILDIVLDRAADEWRHVGAASSRAGTVLIRAHMRDKS